MSELPELPNEPPPVEVRLKGSDGWFNVEQYTIHGSGWLTWQKDDVQPDEGGDCGLAHPNDWRFAEAPEIVGFMCGRWGCMPLVDKRWRPRVQ